MENTKSTEDRFKEANQIFKNYLDSQDIEVAKKAKGMYEFLQEDYICPSVNNNLGVLYCELGRYHEAIIQYNQIDDAEKTPENWYNLAVAKYWSGEYEDSLIAIEKLKEKDESFSEAFAMKGKIQIELNKYSEASESFGRAFAIRNDIKYLIWDGYSSYLNAELLKGKEDVNKTKYKNLLTTVIRKLEKAKTVAEMKENRNYYSGTLLFLGCFYTRHDDLLSAKENLIECAENCDDPVLKSGATELLNYIWNRRIKPSWWDWWTDSPKALSGRGKKFFFIFSTIILVLLATSVALHPLFNHYFKGVFRVCCFS